MNFIKKRCYYDIKFERNCNEGARKNPYKLMMEDVRRQSDVAAKPATELSYSTDVLTFSVYRVGVNFENIPYSVNSKKYNRYYMDVDLIGIDGEIVETVNSSNFCRIKNSDDYKAEKEGFCFKSEQSTIIVAMVLKERKDVGEYTQKTIMLLSEPHTIEMIKNKRQTVFNKRNSEKIEADLKAIETIWS